MSDPIIERLPGDLEALLARERPLPEPSREMANRLYRRIAKTLGLGIGGVMGGGILLALLAAAGILISGFFGSRHLPPPRSAEVVAARPASDRAPLVTPPRRASPPWKLPTPAATVGGHPSSGRWPGWFGQRDVAPRPIAGRVTINGQGAAGVDVALTSVAASPEEHTRTSADGTFAFSPHPAWRFTISAFRSGFTPAVEIFDLRDPAVRADALTLALAPCTLPLHGRVLDEGANPIAGAAVRLDPSAASVPSNASGHYTICLPPASATLRVEAPGFGTRIFQIPPSQTERDFILQVDATVLGTVTAEGRPLAGIQVNLWPVAAANAPLKTMTDDLGRYGLAGVAPGRYALNAWGADELSEAPIEVEVTANCVSRVNVELTRTHVVRGVVRADGIEVVGALIHAVSSEGLESMHAVTQPDGSFTIESVPNGEATLSIRGYTVQSPAHLFIPADLAGLEIEATKN